MGAIAVVIRGGALSDPALLTGINQNNQIWYQLLVAFPDNYRPPTFGEN